MATSLRRSAIIGSVSVLPFVILECANRRHLDERFPFVLFGVLWLLPAVFSLVLMSLVPHARPLRLSIALAFLALLAWVWGGILFDQMPCFLGVPDCD